MVGVIKLHNHPTISEPQASATIPSTMPDVQDELRDEARPGSVQPVDARLVERVEALLEEGQRADLDALLADLYAADVARLMGMLSLDEARHIFHLLPDDEAADVLTELDSADRERLLETAAPARIAEILDRLDTDDAADVLGDLREDVALDVLPRLEDAAEVRGLLTYEADTAGGLMATEFVVVPVHATVAQATEEVRRQAEHMDEVYVIFVEDEAGRLVGLVSIKRLLLSPASTFVERIMETDFVSVTVDRDQEDVARIMERYDIVSLPVTDRDGHLVGRITIDDVVDVLREEAEEDLQVISGSSGDEELNSSILEITRGRLPWLAVGLLGTFLSASVVKHFESALEHVVVLAFFIPIMTAMAGNAAIQSAAITVQGLSSGKLLVGDAFRRVFKEMTVALVNGAALSLLLCLIVWGFDLGGPQALRLALVSALALFIVIILATTNGAFIPVVLSRLGIDPAVSMGPFVTTANDILGLTIYFTITTALFL